MSGESPFRVDRRKLLARGGLLAASSVAGAGGYVAAREIADRDEKADGFHSLEHRWALAEAFGFHDDLGGRAKVAETTRALAARLKLGLAEIRGVTVKTPMDEALSSGLVCADAARARAPEVVDRLRGEHRIVASVTRTRTSTSASARASRTATSTSIWQSRLWPRWRRADRATPVRRSEQAPSTRGGAPTRQADRR